MSFRQSKDDTATVFGISFTIRCLTDLLELVTECIESNGRLVLNYGNIRTMNLAYEDAVMKMAMRNADALYADGAGVVLGARLLGNRLPGRMTGADWIWDLCEVAQRRGYSLYFLGGEEGAASEAARILLDRFPQLKIAGTHHGYFNLKDSRPIVKMINEARPHILLVGMGSPVQEKWIFKYKYLLEANVCWAVGGLFNFVAGREKRAPAWMNDHGLEWLFRLLNDPGRLAKRYVVGNPLFMLRIARQWGREKLFAKARMEKQ